jgi:hypothetical protein
MRLAFATFVLVDWACSSAQAVLVDYVSPTHVFSINDILGDFNGTTYGDAGTSSNRSILCGLQTFDSCPNGVEPLVDDGDVLYPIDSEFGFHVTDFEGAEPKVRDGDYQEGFATNIDGGVKIANAASDTYKVKPPLGTWCQGLGATSVKCSTEHYTVMEHVLTCFETVPYFFAEISDPFTQGETCEALDNALSTPTGAPISTQEDLDALLPNDNVNLMNLIDIAKSNDYSLTKKDNGKVLYHWGGRIKCPNDVRLYAKLELPEQWKQANAPDYKVNKALLYIEHLITNNPNDQLHGEDLENKGATGRKPSYKVLDNRSWVSTKECCEGDGDVVGIAEGTGDPTLFVTGTVFK